MEHKFWLEKWQKNEIGFHGDDFNPNLVKNFPLLNLAKGSHVLVPLCGKSLDLLWLKNQGYQVTGVELSSIAVESFFKECNLEYTISQCGNMYKYSSNNSDLKIIQGDFFQLNKIELAPIDAIYDRAAMIALPPHMRVNYFNKLKEIIAKNGQSLLITLEYDQDCIDGPPFSVSEPEIRHNLGKEFIVELIEDAIATNLPPRFHEARIDVHEKIYRLHKL